MPTYEVDFGGKTYEVDAPDPKTAWSYASYSASQTTPAAPNAANVMDANQYRAALEKRKQESPDRSVSDVAVDAGITFLKGAIGLPEAFVGLADIPTGGAIGKLLEDVGYKPREANEILDTYLSEAQQAANRKVKEAEGFGGTVAAALQNPSTILTGIGESLPQMVGGAGVARGILKAAPKVGAVIAGGIGEGILGAGSAAEQIRGENKDKLLTPEQSIAALGSGVGTAAFGVAGGKLANKLGLDDLDTLLAGGSSKGAAKSVGDFAKRAVGSGISEGFFEELPQSGQEKMWMNYATDRPLLEGVPEAMGMGAVTGFAMGVGGGGAGSLISNLQKQEEQKRDKYERPTPDQGIEELARAKGFLTPQAQGQAAPPPPPAAPRAPESESQDLEAMLREALGEEPSKVEAATPIVQAATEAAPIAPAKAPEVEQVPPEVKAEDVFPTTEAPKPAAEKPVTPVAEAPVSRVTSMTKEQFRKDQETIGQSEHSAMKIDLNSVKDPKKLVSKYGERNVRMLGKLHGITVKDIGSVAKKLLAINNNLNTVKGKTADDFNGVNVEGLKNLLKQMGLSAYGNRPQLIQKLTSYEASITGAFNDRLQDAKHKIAIIKAAQNNQPISDEVLKDYPDVALYVRDRNSDIYKSSLQKMVFQMTRNNVGMEIPGIAKDLRAGIDAIEDPREKQVTADIADAMDAYYENTFGTKKEVAPAAAPKPAAPVTPAEKEKSPATKNELEKTTTEAYKKFDKAVKEYNKIYENYQKNKTDENLRKLYEASIRYNELNIAYDEVSLNQAQYEHSIGYLDDSQLETFTENNKNNTNSAKKNIATTNKELEELSKKPSVEKAKPKTALEKASPLRIAAYKKNPFRTFLASKGLYHEKGKPKSQMNEFNAGQQILVSGYGPIFKKSGMLPDDLVVYAIQDGYLPQDATESDLVNLIELAISGKKVEPIYSEQGQEDMAVKYAESAAEAQDSYEERADQTDAEWYGMSEQEYMDQMSQELAATNNEDFKALDDAINELMDTPASTMSARAAMEALGFSEQEIQDEERRTATKAGEAAPTEKAPVPAEGEAPAELELKQQTEKELKAKQDEIDRLTKENERLAKEAEAKAKADAERGEFVLTGSNRPADEAAARGQKDIFAAEEEKPVKQEPKEKAAAEPEPSKEYQLVLNESREAYREFAKAQEAYRAQTIGDDEFLTARKKYDVVMAKYDDAYAKEQERMVAEEVVGPEETPPLPRLTREPYTFEGEFTEKGEEEQIKLLEAPIEKLNKDQINTLEKHYGAKRGSAEFIAGVRQDVIDFVAKGATAVNGKIRAIIRALAHGVLATSLVFNPQFISHAYTVSIPQYDVSQREVLQQVPEGVRKDMSQAAQRAYAVIYPSLKSQLTANNKFFIVADKQTATTFIFNPDGSPFMHDKTLFGAGVGDFMKGDNTVVANRITPAGLFDLGMRDAHRSAEEAYSYGDYDFGKVFVLDKAYMGRNGPYSQLVMHSVWVNEKDAKQRLAALDKPGAEDSRYSFGCINVKKEAFRNLVTNHMPQMDGAKIFIVPENGSNVMDFVNGEATYSPDIIRQRVAPVTEEVKTEKQRAEQRAGAKMYAREEEGRNYYSIQRKLPPGRSPELSAAAQLVKDGQMTAAEYDELVNLYKPIRPYAEALKPATKEQVYDALDSAKREKISPEIPDGTRVGLRLDIPAFNRKGVYVVSIHQKGTKSGPGKVMGYDSVARVTDATFGLGRATAALDIAAGAGKDALQTIEGSYEKISPSDAYAKAQEALNDPAWTQIGIDPTRHAYFYDRSTTQPVIAAEEIIQIGNMVLGKNVTYGDKQQFLYDVAPNEPNFGQKPTDWDYIPEIQEAKKRNPSLTRKLNKLKIDHDAGKITDEKYIEEVDAALELAEVIKEGARVPPRVRGYRRIKEVLNRDVRKGFIDPEAADLAEWFIDKNPDLVEQLGISVKAPSESGVGGFYSEATRIITLIKEGNARGTITHEILHHLERMMPAKIQQSIRKAWSTQLLAAQKKAKTPAEKLYFAALMEAHYGSNDHYMITVTDGDMSVAYVKALSEMHLYGPGNRSALELAKTILKNGGVSIDLYQFFNPSEFWAVNGTRIVEGRYDAVKGSTLAKLKNWLREFAQKIKGLLGLNSDLPILRALDSLSKSDGTFVSKKMLGDGFAYENIHTNYKGGPMPNPTWSMPKSGPWEQFIQTYQDNYLDLKKAQQIITKQSGELDQRLNAYGKEVVSAGRSSSQLKDFAQFEVRPLLTEMLKNNVSNNELSEYLQNRYAPERNEIINEKNQSPSVRDQGSGIHTDDAAKYMKNLDKDRKKILESLAKRIDDIVYQTQENLIASGQETRETIEQWRRDSPHYVPLQRDESEMDFLIDRGGIRGTRGLGTQGKFGRQALGSTKTVVNIIENVMIQRERAVMRSENARIGRALYAQVIANPNPDFWMAIKPGAAKNKEKLLQQMEDFGLDPEFANNIVAEPRTARLTEVSVPNDMFNDKSTRVRTVTYQVDRMYRQAKNVFPVRINGEDVFVLFNPKSVEAIRLVDALKDNDPETIGLVVGAASNFTNWFTAVNSQYNLAFGLINFWNDTQGAWLKLSATPLAGKRRLFEKNVIPALLTLGVELRRQRGYTEKEAAKEFSVLGKGLVSKENIDYLRRMREAGGMTGMRDSMVKTKMHLNLKNKKWSEKISFEEEHLVERELKALQRGPVAKKVIFFADLISDTNDMLENASRLAAFKVAVMPVSEGGLGLSDEEGAIIAKELTINFNKHGARTKNIRGLYGFFNATVQSTANLATTLAGPAGRSIVKYGLMLGAAQAMLLVACGYDDDEPPDFVKNKGFIIPTGNNKYFVWNLPGGFRALPNMGRLITEGMLIATGIQKSNKGLGGKALESAGVLVDAVNPFGNAGSVLQLAAPTFADPIVALTENKDPFGRPIYKEDSNLKPTPGWQRTRDSARTISKGLSYMLNYITSGGEPFAKGFISPTGDEIDYTINQIIGGGGKEIEKGFVAAGNAVTGEPTPAYKRPLLNRVAGEIETPEAESARFYDNVTMLAQHKNIIEGRAREGGDVEGYIKKHPLAQYAGAGSSIENNVSNMNSTLHKLRNMPQTPEMKQTIKEIESARTEAMKVLNDLVKEFQ